MSHKITMASLSIAVWLGLQASLPGRPAPHFEPPTGEKESTTKSIRPMGIPPQLAGGSKPEIGGKPLPTALGKDKRYVIDWDVPLVIGWFSTDSGDVEVVEFSDATVKGYKGWRVYATDKTICSHPPDQDNADVTTITAKYVYEVRYKADGIVYLEAFPATGKPNAEGKTIPLTRDDIVRRVLTLGQGPRPPPDDPVDPDPEIRSLTSQIRTAYTSESASDKATSAKELASLYRTMAKSLSANDATVAKLTTQLQFGEAMKAARSGLIGDKIPEVRSVIGDFFDKKWVVAENAKFDGPAKSKAAASLVQAAKALEAIK